MTFPSKLAALSSGRDTKATSRNDLTTDTYVISCPQKAGGNLSGLLLLNVLVTMFGNTLQATSPVLPYWLCRQSLLGPIFCPLESASGSGMNYIFSAT